MSRILGHAAVVGLYLIVGLLVPGICFSHENGGSDDKGELIEAVEQLADRVHHLEGLLEDVQRRLAVAENRNDTPLLSNRGYPNR